MMCQQTGAKPRTATLKPGYVCRGLGGYIPLTQLNITCYACQHYKEAAEVEVGWGGLLTLEVSRL